MSKRENSLIIVTTPTIPGYEIVKILGSVHGLTVKTNGVGDLIEFLHKLKEGIT